MNLAYKNARVQEILNVVFKLDKCEYSMKMYIKKNHKGNLMFCHLISVIKRCLRQV